MKHTILGAGGAIGNALAYKLLENRQDVRLVSRSGFSINGTESFKADVTQYSETLESIRQSDVVHLCVGLEYKIKVWQEKWHKIMRNTIDACKEAGAKLIFFDNVYMYGHVVGKMTEETPYNPCSKKGEVRAKIARMLQDEISAKNITAIIARSADFYGPYSDKSSVPFILVIDKLLQGKRANWMVNVNQPHSFTYTLDCANALYMLANDVKNFNQTWHLPTFNPAPDGKTFISLVAKELGVPTKYFVLSKPILKITGLFNKTVSELYELLYQSEFDYYFDSTKFNSYFNYQPVSYEQGIRETVEIVKSGYKGI